ncbi:MAG: secretin N-terminal domain-containing protein [Planctomycetota bacterium]
MRRQGILAAGLLTSATAICLLLNRQSGLNASEENEPRSFREALSGDRSEDLDETEDGFRIRYFDATWEKVLRDLAEHEGLTLVMDRVPPGRFARRDPKRYDLETAVRILNSELEPQGFRLLVQKQFLIVLNLDKARTEYARPQLSQQRSLQNRAGVRSVDRGVANPENSPKEESTGPETRLSVRKASSHFEEDDFGSDTDLSGRTRVRTSGRHAAAEDDRGSVSDLESESPIRTVSKTNASVQDDKPVAGDTVSDEIAVLNAKAADLARTIYVVFEKRAELQKEGLQGLPGFTVYDRAEDGTTRKDDGPVFRIGIDQNGNRLLIEASESQLRHLRRLVSELDKPAAASKEEESIRVVENNGISARTARQLNEQIHQLVSLADEKPANPAAVASSGQIQTEDGDPAINLRGEVNVQAMQDLGILILKGNEADVAKVEEIIKRLETMSVGSLPAIHVLTLQNVDSEAMSTLLTSVYEQLTELRQRTGDNRKTAAFIPVVQPNAILIISSEIERESILKLAGELDKPTSPELEFQVFPLKSAIASQVVTALEGFYEEREGLGTSVRAIADVRTNSVIVQGRPNELAEVSKLIDRIDRDEPSSAVRMQIFALRQATAQELSDTINAALQSILNPPQQTGGQGGFGGTGQGAQELRDNKSVALEFLSTSGGVQELIKSGILADVRVSPDVRSNSLIVTAPEATMPLMTALVEALDQSPGATSEIKVFTLKNADAQQSVELLETLFNNTNQEDQIGVQLAGTEGSSSSLIPLRFSADIRTNTVLAVGSADSLSVVEAILLRLDNDDTRQRTTTVIPLRNAPAELVSETLLNFLEQQQALQDSSEDLISNIESIRQQVLVSPDTNSNSLIVSASPQYFAQMQAIIDTLDAQPPEVVVQALIVEVTLDATDEFGIELGFQDPLLLRRGIATAAATTATPGLNFNNTSIGLGNNFTSAAPNTGTVGTQGLSNFSLGRQNSDLGFGGFVFSAQSDAVSVLLRALAARRTVHVLSRPQVRTTHNNLARVNVGQNVPLVDGVTVSQLGTANPQIVRQDTGITLEVTPRITPDGIVAMQVFAEKSSIGGSVPVFVNTDGSSIESSIINQSVADTVVNVPNGQTIVIGGMITKSDESLERKVPWLGDLPVIGRAFRYDGTTVARTELLIFLTPRIVLSDLDSELIKQVESERIHFIESEAEEIHGPLYSVPRSDSHEMIETELPEGTYLNEHGQLIVEPAPGDPAAVPPSTP